jgi:hypothetical protein
MPPEDLNAAGTGALPPGQQPIGNVAGAPPPLDANGADTATHPGAKPPPALKPDAAAVPPQAWNSADYEFVRYLWDQARDAAVYDLYFGDKAASVVARNRQGEIIVAVTAPGSVISGWALWNFSLPSVATLGTPEIAFGHYLWIALGAVASIIALVKPIMRPDLTIANYTRLYSEYRSLNRGFAALVRSVQRRGVDADVEDRCEKLEERMTNADQLRPPKINEPLKATCRQKVLAEYPPETLWAPKVPGLHPKAPN